LCYTSNAAYEAAFLCAIANFRSGDSALIERKKQQDYRGCLLLVVVIILAGFLAWRWVGFNRWRGHLPAGMTLAGVPVEGAKRDEAMERLLGAYNGPIVLHYQDRSLPLFPHDVAFQIDVQATAANLDAELAKHGGLGGFLKYLLGQHPGTVDVPAEAIYSSQALSEFLQYVADQNDRSAKPPIPQPATGEYTAGEPGYRLDIAASVPVVEEALLSTSEREASLVVKKTDPPTPDFGLLGDIIENELTSFPGIASVFAKDLQTGDEIAINADVAYAGMSIIKIAIMVESYRHLDQQPDPDTTKILTETITLSGNFTANLLLRMIGEGDAYRGTEILNGSMRRLGLVNTFMATPYDEDVVPPTIVTEANSRTDLNTEPDPYMQTTPMDMGLLLEMIYLCGLGKGTLMFVYPDGFTADECSAMLDHMLGNQLTGDDDVPVLIAAGLPDGISIAHKHGWVADTRADAAAVFTPGGDYVLVIYLYNPGWVDWDQTNSIMTRISQLVYAYFNPPDTVPSVGVAPGS
jgi:beta-lactamase class A